MLRSPRVGAENPRPETRTVKSRTLLTLLLLVVAMPTWSGCARHRDVARNPTTPKTTGDPCSHRKSGEICLPELPSVAPVVAGAGRLWGLFARGSNFEIREYSTQSDGVLAKGVCPTNTVPAVLGAIDQQPALLCANFELGTVVFGRKLPNSQSFVWQTAELLTRGAEESVQSIAHFALLERRLSVVFRTEKRNSSSGLPNTQWRLQIAGAPSQMASQSPNRKPPPPQSEVLCPRPGVTQCQQAPVTAYVADRQMHVVMASGMSADKYLHLAQAAGKPSTTVPVENVSMTGRSLTSPCVSVSTNGNLKVFVPQRSLVSALQSDQSERVGVIQHQAATIAQGPDVLAGVEDRCPPEVSALAAFPRIASGAGNVPPQWLRATQANDIWLIGYAIPSFATYQNGVTTSYNESFWVVRR